MNVIVETLVKRAAAELMAAGAHEVFVFGSAAKDTMGPDSDIDMAVSGLPKAIFYRVGARLDELAGRTVDLVDLDMDTPLTQHLRRRNELVRVG